jgi:hypothetical protein
MTFDRRLDKIDETLSPTQLVLRWLDEAHAFGDLEPYAASLLTQDPPVTPLDRLAREAMRGARAATRGKRPELVDAAIRSALRETVFRFELVMRIYATTHELVDREFLIHAIFASQLVMLAGDEPQERVEHDSHLQRLDQCRRLTLFRVDELLASREARSAVEARYLDGHPALFPDIAAAFEKQLRASQEVAATAVRLAELDGLPPAAPADPEAFSGRTAELVADLVEPAKVEALDKLGEGEGGRAFDIAAGWVRGKLTPQTDVTTDVASPDAP